MSATTTLARINTHQTVTVAAPTKGGFIDPLTQRWSVTTRLPLAIDRWLAFFASSSNLFWRGSTEEQCNFIRDLETRSLSLWDAAAHLNPKFAQVPLDIAVLSHEHSVNAFTPGYGKVRITKELVKEVLAQEGLTYDQKLDVMSGIVAHEMGHCLQRHITRSVCKRLLLVCIEFLSNSCYPLAWVLDQIMDLWCLLTFDYFTRTHEREADTTGMLILKAYNHLFRQNSDINQIDLSMAPYLWTHFKAFDNKPPTILRLLRTHPSSEERARLTAKLGWILHHNPDILTNPERRAAFFSETRSVSDATLHRDWALPRTELADAIARGTPYHPPTPADRMAAVGRGYIGLISHNQRALITD